MTTIFTSMPGQCQTCALSVQGNVFINQYLIIKDLGKGAHGTVKLVYNTQDDMLYAMKVGATVFAHPYTAREPSLHPHA